MIVPLALFARLAGICAPEVAPGTLATLAAVESRFGTLALYDNTAHAALHPKDRAEAITLARQAIAAGHSVDLGLMQINSRNLAPLHLSVADAFESCASLRAGAALLAKDYGGGKTPEEQQAALRAALSRYNTGTAVGGFANGYVARVVSTVKRIVPEIAPDAATATEPPPAVVPKDWNVFPDSPGPGRLEQQPDTRTTNATEPSAPVRPSIMKPAAPAWNVFPRSAGPDHLTARSAVTLAGHLSLTAKAASEKPNE